MILKQAEAKNEEQRAVEDEKKKVELDQSFTCHISRADRTKDGHHHFPFPE